MHSADAHYLLVGDSRDLVALREAVQNLPADAYGQVFVEVASPLQVEHWRLPAGVSISWLRRDHPADSSVGVLPRGELAARAIGAWLSEWVLDPFEETAVPCLLWIGCSTSDRVDRLYNEVSHRFPNLLLRHPHYDL